jgi:hypothetical protein
LIAGSPTRFKLPRLKVGSRANSAPNHDCDKMDLDDLVVSREATVFMAKRPVNERVEFAMKIMKYRQLARTATLNDPEAEKRAAAFIAELEQKLREIDE